MLYERIIRNLDDAGRLEIDAILGDEVAVRARNDRRLELVMLAGGGLG